MCDESSKLIDSLAFPYNGNEVLQQMNFSQRSVFNLKMNMVMSSKGYMIIFLYLRIGYFFSWFSMNRLYSDTQHCLFLLSCYKVSVKMKQYKDELLASCLTFILSLPHDIIELDVRAYVPALQVDEQIHFFMQSYVS